MKRTLLAAVALLTVALFSGSAGLAQDATGVGVVREIDGTGTGGTVYVLSYTGTLGEDVVPGTQLTINDMSLPLSTIQPGDKVTFRFVLPGPIGLEADELSLARVGTLITTDVFVGIDITSDVDGNLVVESGDVLTISNGAVVDGNIKVKGGGVLLVRDLSFVNGNIRGENGADILIDEASVDGNIANSKDTDREGSLAISQATIDGNVKVNKGLFMGIELSTIFGNVEVKKVTLAGILDSFIDGNIKGKKVDLLAIVGNTIDGDLKVDKIPTEVLVLDNVIDGNLKIKKATLCTETGNVVGHKNSGCPPPPEAPAGGPVMLP